MARYVQRDAQVRRRKSAVQANRSRSRLLKAKCNHDRQQLAGLRPPKGDAQRPERSECCLSSARSGVNERTTAYRCAVQINVSFRARPPTAGLAERQAPSARDRQPLSTHQAALKARATSAVTQSAAGVPDGLSTPRVRRTLFHENRPATESAPYSTVTLFARFRGLSTSVPFTSAA